MIAERLVRHETVDLLLSLLDSPAPPGLPVIDQLWPLLQRGAVPRAEAPRRSGCCRRILRERFGVRWTRAQQTELRALGAASRALTPVLPARLRNVGPEYLRRPPRGDRPRPARAAGRARRAPRRPPLDIYQPVG